MGKLWQKVKVIPLPGQAAYAGGAKILSLINPFTAMAVDIYKRRPRLANVTGGLSGPALKPIAVHMVSRVYRTIARHAGIPIIGMGGIQTRQDPARFILAGAAAAGLGTAPVFRPA